ncbi:L,D-transpeptidase family protein [Rhizobium sp. G187]|uniref:L,D-transpeptidase family protein n=1 Tax=Rhizobium sp. G187 TaxID=3451352 RepID=UPI003EE74164
MIKRFLMTFSLAASTALVCPALAFADGPLQIFVSKATQTLTLYEGDDLVATSKVSTGKTGHRTPSGVFSILEKRKYHKSNIYSDAPMPFMQRLTWSGIALHEGRIPDYPASHGCVRLPRDFARSLYGMTRRGVHVIITEAPIEPRKIVHAALFAPSLPAPSPALLSDARPEPASGLRGSQPVEVAMTASNTRSAPGILREAEEPAALRILITRRTVTDQVRDVQEMLTELGFDTGTADGVLGSKTIAAIKGYRAAHEIGDNGGILSEEFLESLYHIAGRPQPAAGKLLVRSAFEPLFEADVGIRDPHLGLGTHFLVLTSSDRERHTAEWRGATLTDNLTNSAMARLGITQPADNGALSTAEAALARIEIPNDLRSRVETLLGAGSSLTISDNGTSIETGKGTDFITLTRDEMGG